MNRLPASETVTNGQDQRLPASPLSPNPNSPSPAGGEQGERESRKRAGRRVLALGVLAVLVLGGALAAGTLPRLRQEQQVNAAAAAVSVAPPRVTVAVVHAGGGTVERVLPGNSLPLMEASLFARTTGYLKRRLVDIGDRVTEGQLLAEISAPDIDDQLDQAKANVNQAEATLKLNQANAVLAKTVLDRAVRSNSRFTGSVTPEEIDQDRATVATTAASVETTKASIVSFQAAVQRFSDLQGFQKITAPFPGVITARNVDPGDLLTADNPSMTKELFHLMRTDVLRVFVNVPQVFATGIKVGQDATVFGREDPQKQYPGKVARTANALDPNTRTLLTEVDVPNPNDDLRPGMYLQVKFVAQRQVPTIMIPAAALSTRGGEQRVAVLDDQHQVHYRTLQLGRDYGAEVEVVAGLQDGETVVVHPGDDLPEGTVVEPVPLPT